MKWTITNRSAFSDHAFFNIFGAADGQPEKEFARANYKLPRFCLNRFATAVRPQEVFDTLLELAKPRQDDENTLAPAARTLLKQMGVSLDGIDQTLGVSAASIGQMLGTLKKAQDVLQKLPDGAGTELAAALEQTQTSVAKVAGKAVNQAATAATAAWQRFNFWFEAAQDRAQQWFTMHTRFWTIVCAFVFAFVCELDTIEIYRQVSTNSTLRDKLVASAATFTSQAEKVLADTPSVIQDAFNVWRGNHTNPPVSSLIQQLNPRPTETRGKFLERLETALAGQTNATELVANFGKVLDDTAQKRVTQQGTQFAEFKVGLKQSGFPLVVKGGRWAEEKDAAGQILPGPPFLRHFWGMLMTAGLLALGAPFWFNTLKGLTNLRSLVARDISKEEQAKLEATAKSSAAVPSPPARIP